MQTKTNATEEAQETATEVETKAEARSRARSLPPESRTTTLEEYLEKQRQRGAEIIEGDKLGSELRRGKDGSLETGVFGEALKTGSEEEATESEIKMYTGEACHILALALASRQPVRFELYGVFTLGEGSPFEEVPAHVLVYDYDQMRLVDAVTPHGYSDMEELAASGGGLWKRSALGGEPHVATMTEREVIGHVETGDLEDFTVIDLWRASRFALRTMTGPLAPPEIDPGEEIGKPEAIWQAQA